MKTYTANPVRLTGNSLLVNSHREKLVFITGNPVLSTGILFSLQGFPCKTLYFPVRDCSVEDRENKCSFWNDLNPLWSTEFFWLSPLSESKHSSVTTKRGEGKSKKKVLEQLSWSINWLEKLTIYALHQLQIFLLIFLLFSSETHSSQIM